MPILRCGAEMKQLLQVSDDDVQVIENSLKDRIAMGLNRKDAEQSAVDDAIAQATEELNSIITAVNKKVGNEPSPKTQGQENPPVQANADLARLEAALQQAGHGEAARDHPFESVSLRDSDSLSVIAKALGSRIVGFKTRNGLSAAQKKQYGFFSGVTFGDGVIYISDAADRPHLLVLGHEFAHQLEKQNPDLYKKLVSAIQPYINSKKYTEEFSKSSVISEGMNDKQILSEFMGEVFHDGFMDSKFWKAVGENNPGLLKSIRDFLSNLIGKIKSALAGNTPRTKQYLSDYDRVMQIAGDALGEYSKKSDQSETSSSLQFVPESAPGPIWYSSLSRAIDKSKQGRALGAAWKSIISKLSGVKADEIQWSGINEWLDMQKGAIAKEALRDYLKNNGVRVQEVLLGADKKGAAIQANLVAAERAVTAQARAQSFGEREAREYALDIARGDLTVSQTDRMSEAMRPLAATLREAYLARENDERSPTKFDKYQLPGGQNYRELLLTLPGKSLPVSVNEERYYKTFVQKGGDPSWAELNEAQRRDVLRDMPNWTRYSPPAPLFRSSHFDEGNILAHVRFNERIDAQGKPVLLIEEIQSDWAQKVRQENAKPNGEGPAVASIKHAPFVSKTEAWVALAMKRMIRYAAENGFDRVAWTNGTQQAERYDLSKQISYVALSGSNFKAYDLNGKLVIERTGVRPEDLADIIGKDVAEKLMAQPPEGTLRTLQGVDLKVGGDGMKTFYDKIVPNVAKDIIRKMGGITISDVATQEDGNTIQTKGFDVTPEMREQALRGMPMFMRKEVDVAKEKLKERLNAIPKTKEVIPDWAKDFTLEQKEILKKTGAIHVEPTLAGRAEILFKDFGKKFVQGALDQFAPLKDLGMQQYMQARMSYATDGGVEALLLYGKPFLEDNAVNVKTEGGFLDVMKALQGEHDRFFQWVAGMRAGELKKAGKENLLTADDIGFLNALNEGNMPDGTSRVGAYQEALGELQGFNKSILDISEQSGLIDKESRSLWESQFYVPFYRAMEDGVAGPSIKSGLVNQYAFKKLKGGTQNLNDLMKNSLMNWSHLLSAAAKNRAASSAMAEAVKLGVAEEGLESTLRSMSKRGLVEKNIVSVMDEGIRRWYVVNDPYIADALMAIESAGMGSIMKPFQIAKQALTFGVTISPTFKVVNLIRDSISSIGVSDTSYNPFKNLRKGWSATKLGSQTHASMLAGGGMIRFGTLLDGNRAQHPKKLIAAGINPNNILDSKDKIAAYGKKLFDAYQALGDRSENINRAALYERLKEKGFNHLEASYMARDMMDFGLHGKWAAVRFLAQAVPFMNARMQGLYKMGRAAKEDPKRFYSVAAAVAMASLGLMLLGQDDDDWKAREDWDRDAYWWIKIGGQAIYIPKPFEFGSIGTLVERSWELMTNDEMTGKRYRKRLGSLLLDTFALNPMPQLVKPLYEMYANKNMFTGRDIESASLEKLRTEDRITANTSEVAKLLGKSSLPISPVQWDHMLNGYLGSLFVGIGAMTSALIRPAMNRPDTPALRSEDYFLWGKFIKDLPGNHSRYVTEFYDKAKEVGQIYASYRDALKRGDKELAAGIVSENRVELASHKRLTAIQGRMSDLSRAIRRVQDSEELDANQKRLRIDHFRTMQDRLTRNAMQQSTQ